MPMYNPHRNSIWLTYSDQGFCCRCFPYSTHVYSKIVLSSLVCDGHLFLIYGSSNFNMLSEGWSENYRCCIAFQQNIFIFNHSVIRSKKHRLWNWHFGILSALRMLVEIRSFQTLSASLKQLPRRIIYWHHTALFPILLLSQPHTQHCLRTSSLRPYSSPLEYPDLHISFPPTVISSLAFDTAPDP